MRKQILLKIGIMCYDYLVAGETSTARLLAASRRAATLHDERSSTRALGEVGKKEGWKVAEKRTQVLENMERAINVRGLNGLVDSSSRGAERRGDPAPLSYELLDCFAPLAMTALLQSNANRPIAGAELMKNRSPQLPPKPERAA